MGDSVKYGDEGYKCSLEIFTFDVNYITLLWWFQLEMAFKEECGETPSLNEEVCLYNYG